MGGCMSNRSEELKKYKIAFSEKEFQVLDILYQLLLTYDQTNGYLTHKSMLPMFKENPEFSVKLFNWMKALSRTGMVDYPTFVVTLELLLKEQTEYYLSEYKYRVLEKFELFALISLGCLENEKDTINRFQVTYSQGSVVIKELMNMFFFNINIQNSQKNDLAARSVTNAIFDQKASLPFNIFIGNAKSELIYANKMCKKYFIRKFLDPQVTYVLPKLDQASFILNDQILSLLSMSSPVFQSIEGLQKLYSTSVGYDDFEDISQIIVESKQSLLFLFRNREDESQNDTFQQQIFGAFINIDPLIESHYVRKLQKDPLSKFECLIHILLELLYNPNDQISLYFGDEKSFLFSLMPKYQIFMSTFQERSKRYFGYLHSRSFDLKVPQPYGLGFGGDGKGNFRIWIDENLKGENINTVNNQCDQTYELGFILEPHIDQLNLTALEIWSVKVNEEPSDEQQQLAGKEQYEDQSQF